jgi:hypothetical protein
MSVGWWGSMATGQGLGQLWSYFSLSRHGCLCCTSYPAQGALLRKVKRAVKLSLCLINQELRHENSRGVMVYIHHPGPRHWMEVSCQIHFAVALPLEKPPSEPIWTLWSTEKSLARVDNRSPEVCYTGPATHLKEFMLKRTLWLLNTTQKLKRQLYLQL